MSLVITRAPGKLLLSGEYSVFEGYPALVAAVDRFVFCRHDSTPKETYISTPSSPPLPLREKNGCFTAIGDSNGFFRLACNLLSLAYQKGHPITGHFQLDSSALYIPPHKLGLGSSSALAVCMARLFESYPPTIFQLALEACQKTSSTLTSGADVSASCFGGLQKYQYPSLQYSPISLQRPLSFLLAFTGNSQKTSHFVAKTLALKNQHPSLYREAQKGLQAAFDGFNKAFFNYLSDPLGVEAVIQTLPFVNDAFTYLGEKAQISIITPEIKALHELASRHHGGAKPSGAGGGDIVLCFLPESSKTPFMKDARAAGFFTFEAQLSYAGVNASVGDP